MTVDDVSQVQIDQIPADFQAFLDRRSRRSGALPSDDHILDFATRITTQTPSLKGLGFAIPGDEAKGIADELIATAGASHGFLSAQLADDRNGAVRAGASRVRSRMYRG